MEKFFKTKLLLKESKKGTGELKKQYLVFLNMTVK